MVIFCISDSPKLTTGFGNVARMVYQGFHNEGFEVHALGVLDSELDMAKELPYAFYPVAFDPLGFPDVKMLLPRIRPDVVFIMIDPGNLLKYLNTLLDIKKEAKLDFRVLAYPPVEGAPISFFQKEALERAQEMGRLVFWNKASATIAAQEGVINPDYVYFGLDHAPFRKYPDEVRAKLRGMVNLGDKFVVGSVGVNKRTKGFTTLIYTAKALKNRGVDDVVFYMHTEPDHPRMQGYHLRPLVKSYGVEDRVLWKMDNDVDARGKHWLGVPRNRANLDDLLKKRKPGTREGRKKRWIEYDYITRMNCLDVYLDTSEVEGWGLPQMEAMACGVPLLYPNDKGVREELYTGGYMFNPLPERLWGTWHTGARLLTFDPEELADLIVNIKDNKALLGTLSAEGMTSTCTFKWHNAQRELVKRVYETRG